jgi:TP901 family phage tail tape measure protein
VWATIKQGVQYVREIDAALTELKKVTDETEASYDRFLQTASKTAGKLGSTVSDFVNATADFARLGYNIEQASKLAEAASVYKNVGDGITDVAQASESIISTMKAFGIEANNAMGIVDRFNEVGNNFAISSTGIGEAMQRSASALYESGNTIDESIALITAANSVVYIVPRRYSNIATS